MHAYIVLEHLAANFIPSRIAPSLWTVPSVAKSIFSSLVMGHDCAVVMEISFGLYILPSCT
jgi:hypothetical protein